MATTIPNPSKRQKLAVAEKASAEKAANLIPSDLGSVRVQFVDQSTGQPSSAPVSVPVGDATVRNLELLLNTLLRNDEHERVPYKFTFVSSPAKGAASPDEGGTAVDIATDLYHSILQPGLKSTEEIIRLRFAPQAIFKVRAVSRCASSITGHGEAILAASFSPATSAVLATGSGDSSARLWDCDTGTPLHTLKGHTSWVLVVSWSPDSEVLATGSMDNTVRLWSPKSGESLGQPLKGHTKWITSMAWEPYHLQAPGRPRLASCSKDATVRVWDIISKRIEFVLSGHKDSVSCVRWGGTGRIYTASHDRMIKMWDTSKGTLVQTLSAHGHWVNHLALSTDFVLRTGFYDHTKDVPSTIEGKRSKAKERFDKAATSDNKIMERLVSASDDFTMYLWEPLRTTKPINRMLGHQKQVNHVTFSADGSYIASAGWDNHVKLWSARDGAFIATLRGHVGPVYVACFSADSRLLVSGSKDTTLKVWNVRTGKLKEDLPGHKDEVYAVDWSADGEKVGSGGKDKAVRIWRN